MSAASDLTAALNAGDYTGAAVAMSALSSSSQVQTGSVEGQDLSAGAIEAAAAPAIGAGIVFGAA